MYLYYVYTSLHRNSKLREQLQSLKKKETEETKALEDMVAKVEKNLVTSTVSHMHCMHVFVNQLCLYMC